MFDDAIFKIQHDDQPEEIIDSIATAISKFGLAIEVIDENDGFVTYQIVQDVRKGVFEEEN